MFLASTIRPLSDKLRQATLNAYAESAGRRAVPAPEQPMIDHLQRLGYRVIAPASTTTKAA